MSMPLVHSSSYIELSMYVYNCKTFFSFTFRSIKYKVYCANCARHLADDHGLKLFFEIEWLTVVLQRCLPFFELSRVLLFAHKKSWKLQHVKHKRSTTRKKLCSEAIKVTHVFRKRRTQNNAIVWGSPNGAHFFKTMIFPKLLSLFWVLRWWLYRNPMSLNHSKPAEEEEDILHTYHNHDATTLADSATNGHLVFPFYSLRGSQSRGGQVHHTSKKGRALEKHQDPKNNHHHFSYLRHLMLVVCHYAYQVFACFETNTHAKMSKRLADGIQ